MKTFIQFLKESPVGRLRRRVPGSLPPMLPEQRGTRSQELCSPKPERRWRCSQVRLQRASLGKASDVSVLRLLSNITVVLHFLFG
jgi:hypothetical protein